MDISQIGAAPGGAEMRPVRNGERRCPDEEAVRRIGRLVLDGSRDCIAVLSEDGHVLFMNSAAQSWLAPGDLAGVGQSDWLAIWDPAYRDTAALAIKRACSTGTGYFVASTTVDCEVRWWDVHVRAADARHEQSRSLIATARDITVHKETEQRLAAALAQKDLLFREFSHRVLNGLQLVASILRLQRRQTTDEAAQSALRSAEQRVHAMAIVNRRLHAPGGTGSVKMDGYLSRLCEAIRKAIVQEGASELRCHVDARVEMASDRAVVVGFLTAELVTNALKHAKRPGMTSIIEVSLMAEDESYILAVTDNGPGLPDDFNPARSKGLGMTIARSQAQQLGGILEHQPLCPGTQFCVRFPKCLSAGPPQD